MISRGLGMPLSPSRIEYRPSSSEADSGSGEPIVSSPRAAENTLETLPNDLFGVICDFCDAAALLRLGHCSSRLAGYLGVTSLKSCYRWGARLQRTLALRCAARRALVTKAVVAAGWPGTWIEADDMPGAAFTLAILTMDPAEVRQATAYLEDLPLSSRLPSGLLEHKIQNWDRGLYEAAPVNYTAAIADRFVNDLEDRLRSATQLRSLHPVTAVQGEATAPSDGPPIRATNVWQILFPLVPDTYTEAELHDMAFLIAHSLITRHQIYESEGDCKRARIVRLMGRCGGTAELRYFDMLRHGSFPCFRASLIWIPGSFRLGDILCERFDADSRQPQLFSAGFGRVEMDIRPRLFGDQFLALRRCLRLPDTFPLELLWNVVAVVAIGDSFDNHHASFEHQYHSTLLECVHAEFPSSRSPTLSV